MAFVKKTWKDRLVEFPGRRKLKDINTNTESVYDVTRAEGELFQAGDAYNAENMNDLENRIDNGFIQLNSDLGGFMPVIDETGKITGYKTTVGGADTVFPFSEIDKAMLIDALSNSGLGLTINSTPEQIYAALANKFPGKVILFNNGTFASGYGLGAAHYAPGSSASNTAFHTQRSQVTVSSGVITTKVWSYDGADKNWSASWYFNKVINFTGYKKLVAVCSSNNGGYSMVLKVGTALPSTGSDPNSVAVTKSLSVPNAGTFEMDISGLSGNFYVWFTHWSYYNSNQYSVSFKEIYLVA